MKKYLIVWWLQMRLSLQTALENRYAAVLFIIAKFIRFVFYLGFLWLIGSKVSVVKGYSIQQLTTFLLIFNFFDVIGQFFFRGIYSFRSQVVSGEFDFRLVKPLSSLFQALTRQTDFLDAPLLIVIITAMYIHGIRLSPDFIISSIAALLLITSFHIIVAAIGVLTTEVDHTVMIYRDISSFARFPTDIYGNITQFMLTYVIPIAVIYTVPSQVLIGTRNFTSIIIPTLLSFIVFILSLKLWGHALKHYTSASS